MHPVKGFQDIFIESFLEKEVVCLIKIKIRRLAEAENWGTGVEFLPQTPIFYSLYLCNSMS